MTGQWRRTLTRWLPVFEYLLAGNVRMILVLFGVLVAGWYFLTEYFWQPLLHSRHEELEYVFLGCPVGALVLRAMQVRRGIDQVRTLKPARLPAMTRGVSPAMLAAMCDRITVEDPRAKAFFAWVGKKLRKADPRLRLRLHEIPAAWRRRPLHWAGLVLRASLPVAAGIFLASPWQYYLGDSLARGLDHVASGAYITGGQTCELALTGPCSPPMNAELWPGDVISLHGDAPTAGRLRIQVRNWPRSGRHVHFRSKGMYVVDSANTGIDLTIPVRGRVLELPYFVNDNNTWALWAEIEYFPFRGEKFTTATYSGVTVPPAIPPASYGGATQGGTPEGDK